MIAGRVGGGNRFAPLVRSSARLLSAASGMGRRRKLVVSRFLAGLAMPAYGPILCAYQRLIALRPAIPSAVDPPIGERAGARVATARGPGTITTNAGGPGVGLLGLPESMVGGMAGSLHPGAGAAPAGGTLGIWLSRGCGAPGARGRRPSAARKGGPSAHGAPRLRGALTPSKDEFGSASRLSRPRLMRDIPGGGGQRSTSGSGRSPGVPAGPGRRHRRGARRHPAARVGLVKVWADRQSATPTSGPARRPAAARIRPVPPARPGRDTG
jgi:hypothetical protein